MRVKIFKRKEFNREELKNAILNPKLSTFYFFVLYWAVILICFITFLIVLTNLLIYLYPLIYLLIIISPVILMFLRVIFQLLRQMPSYDSYYNDNLIPIVDAFKIYLGCKGKRRDNKKIDFLIERIEVAEKHFKKLKKLYSISSIVYFGSLLVLIQYSILFQQNLFSSQFWGTLFLIENYVLLGLLMIRSYHLKNLKQARVLFDYIFIKELDSIYSKLEKITFYEISTTSENDILESIKIWYDLFCGIYHVKGENCEDLIYENRLGFVEISELDKFYNLFHILRINLFNKKVETDSEDKEGKLINSLKNYIEILSFKLTQKTKEKTKKDKQNQYFQSIIVISISLFSLLFSITRIFF